MCSVMNALTSVQLSMAQYVAVFTCESKYRFDEQTSHPFTTWELQSMCTDVHSISSGNEVRFTYHGDELPFKIETITVFIKIKPYTSIH